MVNVPKQKNTFCRKCKKHTKQKVSQYKTGKASIFAQGERQTAPQLPDALRCQGALRAARAHVADVIARVCLSRRQAAVRPEAVRFRWTDEARFPQEGEDHKEDLSAYGVQQVQAEVPARDQALQALRAWRPEEGARSLRLRVEPATLCERGWLGCLQTIASRSVALYARECGNRCGRLQSEVGECTGRERRSGGDSADSYFESLCRG